MWEGKARADWEHTSSLLSLIANCNRDPKKKPSPYTAAHFNPFAKAKDRYQKPTGIPFNRDTSAAIAKAFTGKSFDDVQPPPPIDLPEIQWPPPR